MAALSCVEAEMRARICAENRAKEAEQELANTRKYIAGREAELELRETRIQRREEEDQEWQDLFNAEVEDRKKAMSRVAELERALLESTKKTEEYRARFEALKASPTRKHAKFFTADEHAQFKETIRRFVLNHLSASDDQDKFIPTAKIQDHFKAMHPDIKFNSAIFCKELKAIIEANHSSAKPAKTKVKGYHGVSMS